MPVTRNFYVSHQWLRELKQRGQRTFCGVYFRIPDREIVVVGRYNSEHVEMPAARAAALIAASRAEGFEVFIPRRVDAKEISRVRHLPQVLGWRYYPEAHGSRPCPCEICQKGVFGGRRIRKRLGSA